MYPFPQNVNPAVRTHVDAQTAFLNDMSKTLFKSFSQIVDLNIQLMQTMLEETTLAGSKVLAADRQTDAISAAAGRAQPATDKLRAYQQHITRLAADAQVELARVTQEHVQNTARTARALADQVAHDATEQTERGLRAQQETIQKFSDPFARTGDGAASSGISGNGAAGTSAGSQGMQQGAQAGRDAGRESQRGGAAAH